jgi:hypothetical protein
MIDHLEPISIDLVPEDQRLATTEKLFGNHFPLAIEPAIYAFADHLCADYRGGYWDFYTLSNGGFYMAPNQQSDFHVICSNQFEGELQPNAFGMTACCYAYSHLSFSEDDSLSQLCAKHYHLLRDAVLDHPDGSKILAACD